MFGYFAEMNWKFMWFFAIFKQYDQVISKSQQSNPQHHESDTHITDSYTTSRTQLMQKTISLSLSKIIAKLESITQNNDPSQATQHNGTNNNE